MRREFNYEPLTPTAFLHRSANVFPDRIGVVDGDIKFAYGEFLERCLRFSGALRALGVKPGDRVALLAGNSHVMLAAHYAVPFSGGILVALNTRITPADMAFILKHSGSTVLIYDQDFAGAATAAGAEVGKSLRLIRAGGANDELETLIADGKPLLHEVTDERAMLAINYTSGTTARPKGVMYHHRGAYLQSLAMAMHMGLNSDSVHLWTLPMFHCNGWCFPWAVTAAGGMHLCLPKLDASSIWRHMRESGVTHFCAAPTVLTMTIWDPGASKLPRPVRIGTGGAPPTPSLLERLAELGMDITHLYGLTETYGPSVICDWRSEWNGLPIPEQARLKSRQGVNNVIGQPIRVVDDSGGDVPRDGETMGEVIMRGNNVMSGYFNDEAATSKAFAGGWFHSGDLAVWHPDGNIELRDRGKDIIISGGENISSIEVEQTIAAHPAVLECAVIGIPHPHWGERPKAFITLNEDAAADAGEIIAFCRERLAHYKCPDSIVFGPLPKTSTGKTQKFVLRQREWADQDTQVGGV